MLGRRSGSPAGGRSIARLLPEAVVTLSGRRAAKGPELGFFRLVRSALRQLAGMPDYERHIQHLREFHPEESIPTERQFYLEFVQARYGNGPSRCC